MNEQLQRGQSSYTLGRQIFGGSKRYRYGIECPDTEVALEKVAIW